MKKWIIGLFTLSSLTAQAEERSFLIRNIDSGFAGQGYCSLVFSLDALATFDNPLQIDIQYLNKKKVIAKSTIDVPPFGQSRANQNIHAFSEWLCDEFTELKIVNVWEFRNGNKVRLPLSVAIPDRYEPAKIIK